MRRARPYRGENPEPGKDVRGELDPWPGIREQPGSIATGRSKLQVEQCPQCPVSDGRPEKDGLSLSANKRRTAVRQLGLFASRLIQIFGVVARTL
jgi:hypothetical protein